MDRFLGFFREKKWKKMKKDQWLILLLAGILLLVVALPTDCGQRSTKQDSGKGKTTEKDTDAQDYVTVLEKRMKKILTQMDGVGEVEVMITLKDQGESVVEKDDSASQETQTDTSGTDGETTRSQTDTSEKTVYDTEDGQGSPFVSKEIVPKIDGVLVVAEGGADTVTAENISEAVQALFSVEPHKIKVVKMNLQEGNR